MQKLILPTILAFLIIVILFTVVKLKPFQPAVNSSIDEKVSVTNYSDQETEKPKTPAGEEITLSNGWKKYINEEMGFSIEHPSYIVLKDEIGWIVRFADNDSQWFNIYVSPEKLKKSSISKDFENNINWANEEATRSSSQMEFSYEIFGGGIYPAVVSIFQSGTEKYHGQTYDVRISANRTYNIVGFTQSTLPPARFADMKRIIKTFTVEGVDVFSDEDKLF